MAWSSRGRRRIPAETDERWHTVSLTLSHHMHASLRLIPPASTRTQSYVGRLGLQSRTVRCVCACRRARAGSGSSSLEQQSCLSLLLPPCYACLLLRLASSIDSLLELRLIPYDRRDYDYVTIICNNHLRIYRPKPKQTCMCSVLELEGRLLGEGGQYWLAWSLCNANAASQFHR